MKAKFIYETINFTRGKEDKMSSLGVGQVHLIESWLDKMGVENYIINDDFTINVNGDVDLDYRNLIEFPYYIQFNIIDGYFDCSDNQLISLRGCPKMVNKEFGCDNNKRKFTEDEVRKLCNVKKDIYV